jgi:iron complex outermembrane receptor protein
LVKIALFAKLDLTFVKKLLLLYTLISFSATFSFAQNCIQISDAKTGESVPFVIGVLDSTEKLASDEFGKLCLEEYQPGIHSLKLFCVGYRDTIIDLQLPLLQMTNIQLHALELNLDILIISSTRYIKPIEKAMVSMEVVRSEDLVRKITPNLSDAMERLSGVTIIDGQASIRGGSGYAFGAGSRVQLVLDDVPLISADRNDIKWSFIPLEIIDQIEVTKGAASVAYGASALNGIIQIRTKYPEGKSWNRLSTFHTINPQPAGTADAWTDNCIPFQSNVSFSHGHTTAKGMDVVLGANAYSQMGWLQGESDRRARISFKTRKFFKDGKYSAGIDGNVLFKRQGVFLFWANDSVDAYRPYSLNTNFFTQDLWGNIDTWLKWNDDFSNRHALKARYYSTTQPSATGWYAQSHNFTLDYQLKRTIIFDIALSTGLSATHSLLRDASVDGLHQGNQGGAFLQLQKSWNKFEFQAGWRYEFFRIDSIVSKSIPVQSYGVNYSINEKTFLRASYGEGYRFPSPIERYLKYAIDIINIYPNPLLQPERGWNYEVGVKRKFKYDKWVGYLDLALFHTRYKNMTEFSFGVWGKPRDPLYGFGFKSINVTNARILGAELSANCEGKIGDVKLIMNGGYSYICPVDVGVDSTLKDFGKFMKFAVNTFGHLQTAEDSPILKYRYRHMMKFNADIETSNGWSIGSGVRMYSYMEQVDIVFAWFIPGLTNYRAVNQRTNFIVDARCGYQFNENHRVTLHCTNLFNHFVALRPAKPEAPRGIGFQYQLNF